MELEIGLHAPDQALHVFEDHEDGEGHEQLERVVFAVDPLQDETLDGAAEDEGDQSSGDELQGEGEPGRVAGGENGPAQGGRDIGTDRVEGAMRHIQDAQHAEDQGQADRDQKHQSGVGDTVEDGKGEELQVHQHLMVIGENQHRRRGGVMARDVARESSAATSSHPLRPGLPHCKMRKITSEKLSCAILKACW